MKPLNMESTATLIGEAISLLEFLNSRRKPLIKRKIIYRQEDGKLRIDIVVGFDCIGTYSVNNETEDVYYKGMVTLDSMLRDNEDLPYNAEILKRNEEFAVMFPNLTHLRKLNKFVGMSKPSKKVLASTKYVNKSFKLVDGEILDVTSPEARVGVEDGENVLPRKEDLMNQKVYIHGRDPVTNSMLMSRDYNMKPFDLNRLIFEVIGMNPHLVKDLHIDYYADKVDNGGINVTMSIDMVTKYYSIHEELHAEIIANMPKAKELDTMFKRTSIGRTYVKAFIALKEDMYASGKAPGEIKEILLARRSNTSRLKARLELEVIAKGNLPRNLFIRFERSLFNHINFKLGIDAISLKNGNNRNIQSKRLQEDLKWVEGIIINLFDVLVSKSISKNFFIGFANMLVRELDVGSKSQPSIKRFVDDTLSQPNSFKTITSNIFVDPYKDLNMNKQKAFSYTVFNKLFGSIEMEL